MLVVELLIVRELSSSLKNPFKITRTLVLRVSSCFKTDYLPYEGFFVRVYVTREIFFAEPTACQ